MTILQTKRGTLCAVYVLFHLNLHQMQLLRLQS